MKINILNYTFTPTNKTISFDDYTSIRLDSILLITNVNLNKIIYNFADPTSGGTVVGNSLMLNYDTTLMSPTDSLQIFYDDGQVPASNNDNLLFRKLLNLFKPLTIVTSGTNRLNIDVNAITTLPTLANVTTVATVTTVTNQTQVGGISGFDLQYNTARNAFVNTTRQNITF